MYAIRSKMRAPRQTALSTLAHIDEPSSRQDGKTFAPVVVVHRYSTTRQTCACTKNPLTAETTGKVRPVPKTYLLPPVIKDEVTVHAHAKPLAKTCARKTPQTESTETSCRQVDHHLNVEENTVHARDRAWSDADEPAWCTHYLEDPLVRDRVGGCFELLL